MHSQEHTSLKYSLSRDTKRDNGKNVFLVRASGTLTESLQVCVVFSLFWSRKQQVQHILCCDEPVWCYWRQERIQIFRARITVEGLGQGRVTWAPCSVMYCVWCLSCTWSLCLTFQLQKRSNSTTLLLSFFFSILLKTLLYYLGAHHFGTGTRLFWTPHIVGGVWGFPRPRILSYLLSSRR